MPVKHKPQQPASTQKSRQPIRPVEPAQSQVETEGAQPETPFPRRGASTAPLKPPFALAQRQGYARAVRRKVGNDRFSRMLPQQPRQKFDGSPQYYTLQREDGDVAGVTDEYFYREDVETARAAATARFLSMQAATAAGDRAVDRSRSHLQVVANRYEQAYNRYSAVVRAGRGEALNQERWRNIVVGVVAGTVASVVVAAAAAAALPAAAGAAAWTGTWWAMQAGQAGASAVISTGAADVVSSGGLTAVAGRELEPGGLEPSLLQLRMWRSLEQMNRDIRRMQTHATNLFLLNGAAEYAIGEIRAHVDGGRTDMGQVEVLELVDSILESHDSLESLDTSLPDARTRFQQLETAASEPPSRTVDQMEQDIWVGWMASLRMDESDILDLDEIENHLASIGVLGASGRLGVDFGWYTSEADEQEAITAARRDSTDIERQYNDIGNPAPE
jgi:hypothetical protein